jgi:hypothetical protein
MCVVSACGRDVCAAGQKQKHTTPTPKPDRDSDQAEANRLKGNRDASFRTAEYGAHRSFFFLVPAFASLPFRVGLLQGLLSVAACLFRFGLWQAAPVTAIRALPRASQARVRRMQRAGVGRTTNRRATGPHHLYPGRITAQPTTCDVPRRNARTSSISLTRAFPPCRSSLTLARIWQCGSRGAAGLSGKLPKFTKASVTCTSSFMPMIPRAIRTAPRGTSSAFSFSGASNAGSRSMPTAIPTPTGMLSSTRPPLQHRSICVPSPAPSRPGGGRRGREAAVLAVLSFPLPPLPPLPMPPSANVARVSVVSTYFGQCQSKTSPLGADLGVPRPLGLGSCSLCLSGPLFGGLFRGIPCGPVILVGPSVAFRLRGV